MRKRVGNSKENFIATLEGNREIKVSTANTPFGRESDRWIDGGEWYCIETCYGFTKNVTKTLPITENVTEMLPIVTVKIWTLKMKTLHLPRKKFSFPCSISGIAPFM